MKTFLKLSTTFCAAALAITFASAAHADYVTPNITHDQFGDLKVVVPITSAESPMWNFRLHNIANGVTVTSASGGTLHAKVVLYGGGVKLLVNPDAKTKEAIDAARAAGVQFNVCNFSLKGMDMDWHDLYGVKETDIVPSGFAEVTFLASHGWVVNPAN
jgi:intracellular sulfur oxidation DsrE/DsrF family protein